MVPELEALIERGEASNDPHRRSAAISLEAALREILESKNHRWYLGKLDPAKANRRWRRAEEFKARNQK